jgi:hypothetical protein
MQEYLFISLGDKFIARGYLESRFEQKVRVLRNRGLPEGMGIATHGRTSVSKKGLFQYDRRFSGKMNE